MPGLVEVAQQARDDDTGPLDAAADVLVVDLDVAPDRTQPLGGGGEVRHVGDLEVDEVAGDLRLEVVRGVAGDDLAVVDDDDAVAELVGLVEVVRGEEDGRAAPVAQVGDVGPQVRAGLRVQARGRLVEEHQGRLVDQAHGDVEPAPLATGHRLGLPVPQAVELELVEQLVPAPTGILRRHPVEHPVVGHLVTGSRRAAGGTALGHVADAPTHLLGLADHVVARDRRRTRGRPQERREHPQRRRLPGAVRTEEADHLALGDVDVDVVDGADLRLRPPLPRLEGLDQPAGVDHRRFSVSSYAWGRAGTPAGIAID